MSEFTSDAAAIIEAARKSVEPVVLSRGEVYVHPATGNRLDTLDLEDGPRRPVAKVRPLTVESFTAYVKRHLVEKASTIWVGLSGTVEAVINDHGDDFAGWRDHRAVLALQVTPAWERWTRRDGSLTDQESFAEHIEDGAPEIVTPDAATMLEIAQSIHAASAVQFKSGRRLATGEVQLQYVEQTEASAGQSGDLAVPSEFELALPVFEGEEPYKVIARLRYRIREQELRIGYKLMQIEDVRRDAVKQIADRLRKEFGDVVFEGTPE